MATVTAPAPAPTVTRDDAVATLINKAGQAEATMTALAKEAAAKAAPALNGTLPMGERIQAVVDAYAADFKAVGHNVKAIFVAALTIHAASSDTVVLPVIAEGGKKADKAVPATEALGMSKHNLIEAASQIRETHGFGRKAGGGRKAASPAPAPTQSAAVKTEVDAFNAWLDNLMPYLEDQVYHGKIVAHLIEHGFTIGKAAKGRTIKGSASA